MIFNVPFCSKGMTNKNKQYGEHFYREENTVQDICKVDFLKSKTGYPCFSQYICLILEAAKGRKAHESLKYSTIYLPIIDYKVQFIYSCHG